MDFTGDPAADLGDPGQRRCPAHACVDRSTTSHYEVHSIAKYGHAGFQLPRLTVHVEPLLVAHASGSRPWLPSQFDRSAAARAYAAAAAAQEGVRHHAGQ